MDLFSHIDAKKLEDYLNSLETKAHMARLDAERVAQKKACIEQGHPNLQESGTSYFGNQARIYWICPDCNEHGQRNLTLQEEKDFIDHMNEPIGATYL
ncbi:hypothetical protein HY492_01175 [Candidatus Woesearchaeota archaeon]|nr:hypothetical protein [Candidatus Woesearchaeota archaeon]